VDLLVGPEPEEQIQVLREELVVVLESEAEQGLGDQPKVIE
jgi:hypothetical protein